jgi:hypothetical protein
VTAVDLEPKVVIGKEPKPKTIDLPRGDVKFIGKDTLGDIEDKLKKLTDKLKKIFNVPEAKLNLESLELSNLGKNFVRPEKKINFITEEPKTKGGTTTRRPVSIRDVDKGILPPNQEFNLKTQDIIFKFNAGNISEKDAEKKLRSAEKQFINRSVTESLPTQALISGSLAAVSVLAPPAGIAIQSLLGLEAIRKRRNIIKFAKANPNAAARIFTTNTLAALVGGGFARALKGARFPSSSEVSNITSKASKGQRSFIFEKPGKITKTPLSKTFKKEFKLGLNEKAIEKFLIKELKNRGINFKKLTVIQRNWLKGQIKAKVRAQPEKFIPKTRQIALRKAKVKNIRKVILERLERKKVVSVSFKKLTKATKTKKIKLTKSQRLALRRFKSKKAIAKRTELRKLSVKKILDKPKLTKAEKAELARRVKSLAVETKKLKLNRAQRIALRKATRKGIRQRQLKQRELSIKKVLERPKLTKAEKVELSKRVKSLAIEEKKLRLTKAERTALKRVAKKERVLEKVKLRKLALKRIKRPLEDPFDLLSRGEKRIIISRTRAIAKAQPKRFIPASRKQVLQQVQKQIPKIKLEKVFKVKTGKLTKLQKLALKRARQVRKQQSQVRTNLKVLKTKQNVVNKQIKQSNKLVSKEIKQLTKKKISKIISQNKFDKLKKLLKKKHKSRIKSLRQKQKPLTKKSASLLLKRAQLKKNAQKLKFQIVGQQSFIFAQLERQVAKQKFAPLLKQIQKLQQGQGQLLKQKQRTKEGQRQRFKQIQQLQQKLVQTQKLIQIQAQKAKVKIPSNLLQKLKLIEKFPPIRFPIKKKRKVSVPKKKPQAFNVKARPLKKKGAKKRPKLITVDKRLSKKDAERLGSTIVDNTLARTFKLEPTKGKPKKPKFKTKSFQRKKFRSFRIIKGKKVPLENTFIERKGKALIDTKGEKQGLTLRKGIKQLQKVRVKRKSVRRITPTQRKILLKRLEKARRVRLKKLKGGKK